MQDIISNSTITHTRCLHSHFKQKMQLLWTNLPSAKLKIKLMAWHLKTKFKNSPKFPLNLVEFPLNAPWIQWCVDVARGGFKALHYISNAHYITSIYLWSCSRRLEQNGVSLCPTEGWQKPLPRTGCLLQDFSGLRC